MYECREKALVRSFPVVPVSSKLVPPLCNPKRPACCSRHCSTGGTSHAATPYCDELFESRAAAQIMRRDMSTLRRLRDSWTLQVTTIILVCFGNAFSQVSYRVTDLGVNKSSDNFNMVMGLNNLGWAENMDGVLNPPIKSTSTTVASGRAVISIYGLNIDLRTLGGDNSW